MGLLYFTLSMLCLCLCLEASGAISIHDLRHVMYPLMDPRSPTVLRSTERQLANIGTCSVEEFVQKASSVSCQSSLAQPGVNAYAGCGYNELAELLVDTCRTLNGKTCVSLVGAEVNNVISLFTNCLSSTSSGTRFTCSLSQCRVTAEALLSRLGCCFNVLDNTEVTRALGIANNVIPSVTDLVTLCGLTPPPQRCSTPSSLTFTPSTVPRCSTNELTNRILKEVSCKPEVQKVLFDIYSSCNVETFISALVDACRVNENGDFCSTLAQNLAIDNSNIQRSCTSSSTCSNDCRDAIKMFRSDAGCCINALYNSTTSGTSTTSYELWSRCGVDTVGQCVSTLSSAMALVATKAMIILALLAVLV